MKSIFFDLDDTLINTNQSKEKTFEYLLIKHCKKKVCFSVLENLKKYYSDYNYIEIYQIFLKEEFNINIKVETIKQKYDEYYIKNASAVEMVMVDFDTLLQLKKKYNLYIVSNRPRELYDNIWSELLNPYFDKVFFSGDFKDLEQQKKYFLLKKSLEVLEKSDLNLKNSFYVGNEINDMIIARKNNLIGIALKHKENKEVLIEAGASYVITNINDLLNIL